MEEMKIRFEVGINNDSTSLNKDEYMDKINKSIRQAEFRKTIKLEKNQQKVF
jgi:hypothetical protein